jgi:hypothetical protein
MVQDHPSRGGVMRRRLGSFCLGYYNSESCLQFKELTSQHLNKDIELEQ